MYCYIFGAMPVKNFGFKIEKNDLVIAADAGLKNTEKFSIKPDIIVGDFDSLKTRPKGNNVITHPVEKNDTDTLLAVKLAFKKGYKNFRIFGCIGGRLDHTFGSVQTSSYIAENGGKGVFYGNDENFTVIKNDSITFNNECAGNISVFSVSGISKGVNIKNLHYELKNGELTPNFPLGVSNEFAGKESIISVDDGKLLIIWQNKFGDFKIGGKYE